MQTYKNGASRDGVYTVGLDNKRSLQVRCDMTTDGGGWTIFQRRFDGSVYFYRGWDDYKNSFGEMNGEHWLGLDNVYRFNIIGENVLRIDLEDFNGEHRHAQYGIFEVGPEDKNYTLRVEHYSGTYRLNLFLQICINFINIDEIFQLEFFVLWANYVTLCIMFAVEYQLFMYSMRKILVILK